MALAISADVETTLGRTLTTSELLLVSNLLEEASDLVIGYLGVTPDPVPAPVIRVVASMVAAVFTKPSVNTAQYQAGGYNSTRESAMVHLGQESATSTGPWLTKSLKERLIPFRRTVVAIDLRSEVAP